MEAQDSEDSHAEQANDSLQLSSNVLETPFSTGQGQRENFFGKRFFKRCIYIYMYVCVYVCINIYIYTSTVYLYISGYRYFLFLYQILQVISSILALFFVEPPEIVTTYYFGGSPHGGPSSLIVDHRSCQLCMEVNPWAEKFSDQ